jgi:hypothetical protein
MRVPQWPSPWIKHDGPSRTWEHHRNHPCGLCDVLDDIAEMAGTGRKVPRSPLVRRPSAIKTMANPR